MEPPKTDFEEVYSSKADQYERLVAREDYQHNIETALMKIRNLNGLDILDSGAGTGRLAVMFAPIAKSITACDLSAEMLSIAAKRLKLSGLSHWRTEVADHRSLPIPDNSMDVVMSGWSVVYTVVWNPGNWRTELEKALTELFRILRPGGTIIILETNGTGESSPNPPSDLLEYFSFLDQAGYNRTWIRTDYRFQSMDEAKELVTFFFGEMMIDKIIPSNPPTLPECTGIWWKTK